MNNEKINKGTSIALVIFIVTTVAFGITALFYYGKHSESVIREKALQLNLQKVQAIVATGPCGDSFSVIIDVEDDDVSPQYVVAGKVVSQGELNNYAPRVNPQTGATEVVEMQQGEYPKVVMTRPKK